MAEHQWRSISTGEYGNDFICLRCRAEQWIEGTGSFRGKGLPQSGCIEVAKPLPVVDSNGTTWDFKIEPKR